MGNPGAGAVRTTRPACAPGADFRARAAPGASYGAESAQGLTVLAAPCTSSVRQMVFDETGQLDRG